MAKKFCHNERLQEGPAAREEDSGIRISSEKNLITESKKRRRGDDGNVDVDAAIAADNELHGEDGAVVARKQLGSRNPLIGIREMSADTMRSHLLEVPSGFNVIHTLEAFIRRCRRGVIVLSARGTVHNFTLRQPVVVQGIVDNTRVFEIISLSGAFPRAADTLGRTGFKVNLRDAQGNLVGGTVKSMVAHGSVLLILGTVLAINPEVLNVGPKLPDSSKGCSAALPSTFDDSTATDGVSPSYGIAERDGHPVRPSYGIAATDMHPVRPSYGIGSTYGHPRPSYCIGAMDIQPTTLQKPIPIDMMAMNNLVPNLAIGLARPNPHDDSLQARPSIRPNLNLAIGLARPNLHDDSLQARPSVRPNLNLAIGLARPNLHDDSLQAVRPNLNLAVGLAGSNPHNVSPQ